MDKHAKWCVGVKSSGLYKEGVIDGSHLESLLVIAERHASTFGTHRSSRTSTLQALRATTSTASESASYDYDSKENVSVCLN